MVLDQHGSPVSWVSTVGLHADNHSRDLRGNDCCQCLPVGARIASVLRQVAGSEKGVRGGQTALLATGGDSIAPAIRGSSRV